VRRSVTLLPERSKYSAELTAFCRSRASIAPQGLAVQKSLM
jgi:hypothetical protein